MKKGYLAILAFVAGCQGTTEPAPLLEQLPRALTSAERAVIGSSNRFAFDLFGKLADAAPGENVVVSPLSVSMSVGMAMNGAAADTWAEMRDALGFEGLTQEQINTSYRGLLDLFSELDPATQMEIANSVWYRRGFPFENAFLQTVSTSFDAEVRDLDFDDSSSLRTVNDWVRNATHGRIPEILDAIAPNDVMYLINAIYFKGRWRQQFDPAQTRADVFRTSSGEELPVQMMSTQGRFQYGWTERYASVDLPYGNGAFTMTIVLPAEGVGVAEVVDELTAAEWTRVAERLTEGEVMVSLPRFKIEYDETLNDALAALGMEKAFIPGGADFSGMSSTRGRDLYITDVVHKTFIEVNEEGTEAAAATKTAVGVVSAPPRLRVDRPFVFALRERLSGTVFFLGVIERP